jgi:hypothetical protein
VSAHRGSAVKRLLRLCAVLGLVCACSAGASQPVTTEAAPAPLDARYNPAVTQATIDQTICVKNYSASIRPPKWYTGPIKRLLVLALPPTASHRVSDYELDHQVAIEDGGNPTARENLVLQLWAEARAKDKVEDRVHREVCTHKIKLDAGRRCFVIDWKACP